MNNHAVQIDNLSHHFGTFKAVDRISLSVEQGEIFGFLGANGAGKTTAIRMLCGLLLPSEGGGQVAGFDILKQSEEIKKNIGYMSQKFSLYPDLTGRENLNFYGAAYGLDKKYILSRTGELAERLQLEGFINRPTLSLPVGWRQRLALAASLLHKPKILFLDEPTGGVDPVFRREFWHILYQLAEGGVTIFVTTHYMDEAAYCQRISIMHRGQIIMQGKPYDLIEQHQTADLQELFINLIRDRENSDA